MATNKPVPAPASREEALTSLRSTLAWLGDEVKYLDAPVDPVIEATGLIKAFDNGPAFAAQNVTGYPDARLMMNLWGRRERLHKLMGAETHMDAVKRLIHAIENPLPPVEVSSDQAPAQEVVIPKDAFDPFKMLPMVQHTHIDGGRFFGSGCHLLTGEYADGKSQLSFYRMSFRGRDFASINMVPGGHGDQSADKHYDERIPITVNICPPPMVELMAAGSLNAVVFPSGTDELGAAGALQGSPVRIVKAKTVDAYAVADAEWVIEGYVVPSQRVWETEEAEQLGVQGETMFHPEWARYMGRAYRARRFEVTAMTRRADKPYYYVPRFGSIWEWIPFVSATAYALGERVAPGFVQDVTTHTGLLIWGAIVIQVKKRRRSDEGMQRNLLSAIMGVSRGLRLAIVVDEDVDIHEPEEILWALTSRVNPRTDIIQGAAGGKGHAYQPSERTGAKETVSSFEGGIGIDATVPLAQKSHFERARYPVEELDLAKWFSEAEVAEMREQQGKYFRFLGETGLA